MFRQVNVLVERSLLVPLRPSLLLTLQVKGQRKEIQQNVTLTLLFKPRITCSDDVSLKSLLGQIEGYVRGGSRGG